MMVIVSHSFHRVIVALLLAVLLPFSMNGTGIPFLFIDRTERKNYRILPPSVAGYPGTCMMVLLNTDGFVTLMMMCT